LSFSDEKNLEKKLKKKFGAAAKFSKKNWREKEKLEENQRKK